MSEALRLAKKGMGWTFPNPMVGAVLVKNGRIIGKGYHKKVGLPHAEIEALANVTEDPEGATLYVSLEPCAYFGRTPPCVLEIIKKKIAQVVCAVLDPNPKVNGKGIDILKKAGIIVKTGVCVEKAVQLNEAFFTFHQKKRPFVGIKFAASLDGKIATKTGDSKWITNENARIFARSLRAEYHAILVGINTVLYDNPNLGVRQIGKRDPLRIILDSTLKIPLTNDVLRDTNILLLTTKKAEKDKKELLENKGFEVAVIADEKISVKDIIDALKKRNIISVFIEGGAETLGSFVDAKTVDRVYAFYAPLLLGGREALTAIEGEGITKISEALRLHDVTYKFFDDNVLLSGSCDTII